MRARAAILVVLALLTLSAALAAPARAGSAPFVLPAALVGAPVQITHGVYTSKVGAISYVYSASDLFGVATRGMLYSVSLALPSPQAAKALSMATFAYFTTPSMQGRVTVGLGPANSRVLVWSVREVAASGCRLAFGWNTGRVTGAVAMLSDNPSDCAWESGYGTAIMNALVRWTATPTSQGEV